MISARILAQAISVIGLVACSGSQAPRPEDLCQADIRDWLPGPDSAEFLAFEPISPQQWADQIVDVMTHHMINDPPYIRDVLVAQVRNRALSKAQSVAAQGGSFYRYAVRWRVSGASRSSWQFCAVAGSACSCASREERAAGHLPVLVF